MNPAGALQLSAQPGQLEVRWQCGNLVPGGNRSGGTTGGELVDWSRKQLSASLALNQIQLIVQTALNASEGIDCMLDAARCRALELKDAHNSQATASIVDDVDALLEQTDAMVAEAALGSINLLGCSEGCWRIPYLLCEVQAGEHYHNLITTGICIGAIRETVDGGIPRLVGLYALSTDETDPVCWIPSLSFTQQLQDSEVGCELSGREVDRFVTEVEKLQSTVSQLQQQLYLYKKQVDDAVTDLALEIF